MNENTRAEIDLAGAWEIAFDPNNEGVREGWNRQNWPQEHARPVHVPGIWNIDYPDADGVGFYRTSFSIPEDWQDRQVLLHFEGAMYRCEVWIDGKFAGSHEGGYTPFWFNITGLVVPGARHQLVARVTALSKSGPVEGMVLQQTPLSKQSWYYAYGGLWGRVTLEATAHIVCQSVQIDPDLRAEQARVELRIQNWRDEYRQVDLQLRVLDPHGAPAHEQSSSIPVPPGLSRFSYRLELPRPIPWSFAEPNLYRLEARLADGDEQQDLVTEHFGMRDFAARDGQFTLNGEPVFIRGILLQPYFPVTLVTYPDPEMMRREITLAKEAGFNLIRIHIQPAPPGFLDLADRMGMLVYAESCLAWIRESPRMLDHGWREMAAMIERDRNHPSIVFWGVYNENPPASALYGLELARRAHALDPTRVIVDNSGGSLAIDQDFGWLDRATATSSGEAQAERYLDVHLYLGSPLPAGIYDWLRALGSGAPSQPLLEEGLASTAVMDEFERESRIYHGKVFVSELGYGGMSDLVETVAGFAGREDLLDAREYKILRDGLLQGFRQRNLERVFGSPGNLALEAQKLQSLGNTQQLDAVLCNHRTSGYVLTQLQDVAWEFHGGLLDIWRRPKLSYYAAQSVNTPYRIVLRTRQASTFLHESVELELCLAGRDQPTPAPGSLFVEVTAPTGEQVLSEEMGIPAGARIHTLDSLHWEARTPGSYRIAARFSLNGETLSRTEDSMLALERVDWGSLPQQFACYGKAPEFPGFQGAQAQGAGPGCLLAAYPDTLTTQDWDDLLAGVRLGGVAVCGALRPGDQAALQALNQHNIPVRLHPGIGSWMGCYHWIPDSELFAGLPSKCLAMKPYTEVTPKYILSEMGGEVQAGSLRNTQSHQEALAMVWFSDIEWLPYGSGAILFCQYRAFEKIARDAVAARLAYNLLSYAARQRG